MKNLLAIFLCFLSLKAYSFIILDLGLTHKKGIDKGLVLVSELHTREKIRPGQKVTITTKGRIKFEFRSYLKANPLDIGPSVEMHIEGILTHSNGQLIKEFKKGDLVLNISEPQDFSFTQIEGQLIELDLLANLR